MHRNTDEIEKLRKMMKDFDAQLVEMMQQIKDLADSKSLLQQELDELNAAAQAVVNMVETSEEDAGTPLTLLERLQITPQGIMKYLSTPPDSMCLMYSGW